MFKGPSLNISQQFNDIAGEDQLSIKYVAVNISNELLNGITTITPRARYWSFYTWVLYDFIFNSKMERTSGNFKKYLKRQEWFFILANIAYEEKYGIEMPYIQGITVGKEIWESNISGLFELKTNYIANSYGGYSTYRNVIKLLGLTSDSDRDKNIEIDTLTEYGKNVAEAFEKEIIDTEYYEKYRLSSEPVAKDVLYEYGEKVHINEIGATFDGKELLKKFVSENVNNDYKRRRSESLKYFVYLSKLEGKNNFNEEEWRYIFYDKYSNNSNHNIPKEFIEVAIGWELYVARMYFTYGLEGIWSKLLLAMQYDTVYINQLIEKILNNVNDDILNRKVCDITNKLIDFEERSVNVLNIKKQNNDAVLSGLYLMIDVYNKIVNRNDFDSFHRRLIAFGGKKDISLEYWLSIVNKYKDETVKDLLIFIIENFIIKQHYNTAIEKLYTTHNKTFHFNLDENRLHWIGNDHAAFNGMRVIQGFNIVKDLGLVKEVKK